MPFVAECPYCRVGKVRVPDGAVGWSVPCPNPDCGSYFTVAPPPKHPTTSPRVVAEGESKPVPTTASVSPATLETPTPSVPVNQPSASTAVEEPRGLEPTVEETDSEGDESKSWVAPPSELRPIIAAPWKPTQRVHNAPAALALLFGAAAVLAASVPGVYVASIPLAGVGLLFSLAGIVYAIGREKGMVLAVIATAVNGVTLLMMLVAPGLVNPHLVMESEKPSFELPKLASVPTTGKGEGRVLDDSEWTDASNAAIQREDVWVKVSSARLERVGLESQGRRLLSDQRYLVIRVQLANNGVERVIEYKSWRGYQSASGNARVVLQDSAGRTIASAGFPADTHLVGAVREARIFPDKSLDDLLVFQPPVGDYQHLDLILPGQAVGVQGDFRFRIPRSMVRGVP